jgi:hypothetical protein
MLNWIFIVLDGIKQQSFTHTKVKLTLVQKQILLKIVQKIFRIPDIYCFGGRGWVGLVTYNK